MGYRRIPCDNLVRPYVTNNTALGRNFGAVTKTNVICHTDLPPQHNVVPHSCRPGQAGLCSKETAATDADIVPQLHEIIYFCLRTYPRCSQGGPIHTRVGPNRNMVLNDDPPHVTHFHRTFHPGKKTESIGADDRSGTDVHVGSNPSPRAQHGVALNPAALTNRHVLLNHGKGADPGCIVNYRLRMHHRARVNPLPLHFWGKENIDELCHCERGIGMGDRTWNSHIESERAKICGRQDRRRKAGHARERVFAQ